MSLEVISRAAAFSADAHRNQRRKNAEGTPYINHPLRVGAYVARAVTEQGDLSDIDRATIIAAAYLHDTVEDTSVLPMDLQREFGSRITAVVAEVTDNKSLSKLERKQLQVVNAPKKSREAKFVKLADKLDNLTDLLSELPKGWTPEIRRGYFVWAYHTIAGMRGTSELLESELDVVFGKVLTDELRGNPKELAAELEAYYALI